MDDRARLTSKGQVTIPKRVRDVGPRALQLPQHDVRVEQQPHARILDQVGNAEAVSVGTSEKEIKIGRSGRRPNAR